MKKQLVSISILSFFVMAGCNETTKKETTVKVVGAMRNVMHDGKLEGSISLDTLESFENLYGLGPVEFLSGEILIMEGKTFVSKVVNDSVMTVEQTNKVKAPFFVYSNVQEWKEIDLPESVKDLKSLERFLDYKTKNSVRPFTFKLSGIVKSANIHIVNLPKGTKVSSPEEAHEGLISYLIGEEDVDIIGFFSTEHKAVFTHHDTFMHLHLITKDRKKMGHLDELVFIPGKMKLFVSAD